jgi:hypothetical protein
MIALHTIQNVGRDQEEWWQTIMFWTYFFMSFFFFKAGFFNKTVAGDSRQFCLDKAKHLMVPYLTWGAIGSAVYAVYYIVLTAKYKSPIDPLSVEHIWHSSSFYGNPPLWFLFSFFMAYVAIHFMEKVKKLHWIVLAFPLVSYALYRADNPLWFSCNNLFCGIFFFFLGHIWHWLLLKLRRRNTLIISVVLTALFCYLNVRYHGEYTMSQNRWSGVADMAVPLGQGFGGAFVTTLATSLALCGLSGILLSLNLKRIPVVNYIGEHSMVYFVSHAPIILIYKGIHLYYGRSMWHHGEEGIILFMILIFMSTWLVPYVEANPWLSGRFPKTPNPRKAKKV